MSNFRTAGLLISLGVAGVLTLAACGGGDDDDSGSSDSVPADALVVEALDIHYDKDAYEAPAGEVTVALESKGQQVHTLVVFDQDNKVIGDTLEVSPGETTTGTFDLPAGTYQFICDIPGHKDAGMVATLTTN